MADVWIPRIPTGCGNQRPIFFPMLQAEETVRKEPSTYGFHPGWMRWLDAVGYGYPQWKKHRKTYGKDRGHPLQDRDFHSYVSLDGSE